MVDDLQTHALPERSEELERCAVRVGYGMEDRKKAIELFLIDHQHHTKVVNRIFRSLFAKPETSPILKATLRAAAKA